MLVCWWWRFDRSFARLIAPVVTTTSIILTSNKIQSGDVLVPANSGPPGKWPLKRRKRVFMLMFYFDVIVYCFVCYFIFPFSRLATVCLINLPFLFLHRQSAEDVCNQPLCSSASPLLVPPFTRTDFFLHVCFLGFSTVCLPRAGSGVVRMDPLRFLAGCRTRWLNQA